MRLFIISVLLAFASAASAQDVMSIERAAVGGDKVAMYQIALCYLYGSDGLPRDVHKAVQWLEKSSRKGYAQAMTKLGRCYDKGVGVKANTKKAFDLYKRAAKKGDPDALYYTAHLYKEHKLGRKGKPTDKEFMSYLTEAAQKGSPLAQYDLGNMYLHGEAAYRIPRDEANAFELFSKAAEKDDPNALYMLGNCYLEGIGVRLPDQQKAFDCFARSTRAGSIDAYYNLGICYYQGTGTNKDYKSALECFEKASAANIPEAHTMLGEMYYFGLGVPKNTQKALDFLYKGFADGDADAAACLAEIYYDDSSLVTNPAKTFTLFNNAADDNEPGGYAGLGVCYEKGIGTQQSDVKAVDNYILAADRADGFSNYRLYNVYKHGKLGEVKDPKQSAKYLRKAVKVGFAPATLQLAQEQFEGSIIDPDPQGALQNLRKAADDGSAKACALLGNMYYKGNMHVSRDYNVAFKYYELFSRYPESVDRDTRAKAYRNIAACYRFGRGVAADPDKAALYTQKAIDCGETDLQNAIK